MNPLAVDIRPSRRLIVTLICFHALAMAALWLSRLPTWAAATATLALIASAAWYLHSHRCQGSRQLRCDSDGRWRLVEGDQSHMVQLMGEALVTPWLIVLPLRRETGGRVVLTLMSDSAPGEQLRRLRVRLRWPVAATQSS